MDKAILKKFAIESRKDLMEKIKNKINTFYIDEEFKKEQKGEIYVLSNEKHSLSLTNEEYQKRELLIKRIRELSLEQVIEEAAYTWFNRIIAIRYMEINDYLPLTKDNQSLGIRVLSSKDNTPDPAILKFTNLMNPDLDIDFKKEKYVELKDDNEKFKYILLLVCKKLGRVIPQVFDGITDYIDILIPDNLLNDTGFITKVINEVPVENYNQVEIIGWLYQYYNQTEKDRVINSKKIRTKEEVVYVTQLFTPDWIVKYMVENTLGRFGIENLSSHSKISENWKFFIKDNLIKNNTYNLPENITFIDPCCGSGHILVYAFEVLYQIYLDCGYNKENIAELILKNNLFGIDIDERATQLSILAILLKAREYDKRIFSKDICNNLNIINISSAQSYSNTLLDYINNENIRNKALKLINIFSNAKEEGSLIKFEDNEDWKDLINYLENDNTIFGMELKNMIYPLIKQYIILQNKYDIVVTNPPYMSSNLMNSSLKRFINKNYPVAKSDLFAAFIIRNKIFAKENGLLGLLTPYVWMFIKSYEELRNYIIHNMTINSMIQIEYNAFEAACIPVATYTLKNNVTNDMGTYIKLSDFRGSDLQPIKVLEALNTESCDYKFHTSMNKFKKIPGNTIAFWASENFVNLFLNIKKLEEYALPKSGISTGDNNKFLRHWQEVEISNVRFDCKSMEDSENYSEKWFPYNKGGAYRKWYGNNELVINWKDNGKEVRDFNGSTIRNSNYHFLRSLTWSTLSSSNISFRYNDGGFLFDSKGANCIIKDNKYIYYFLGLLNSKIVDKILDFISPTLDFNPGPISKLPIIIDDSKLSLINELVKENIELSKQDWNFYETSWDFKGHPLIKNMTGKYIRDLNEKPNFYLFSVFDDWKHKTEIRFNKLKENEEKLNEIFIDIYRLKDELTPEIEDKDITIRKADKEREIKSLISYAVGCMFGRYSLDKEGLIYAGGEFDEIYKKCNKTDGGWAGASLSNYKVLNDNGQEIDLSFEVDNDNIIPITDESYFGDDIVERFKTFISVVYGEKTLNENLDFIAETLGKRGTETSEDTIRRYFVNDFFNDHVKTYQKRPIYWLFDSGKKNGFKALVYMHRYNENLIPKVRLDYLHRMQTTYEKLLTDVNDKLTSELSMTDKKEAQKRQADLNAKLQEIKEYDEKIAHIANQRISIDLDDGVKVNYDKFKDILAKIK